MARSKADLAAELKNLRSAQRIEGWVSISNNAVRWVGIVLIVRYAYFAIEALAGRQTSAELTLLGNIDVSIALAWCVSAGGVVYGWHQKKLRKDTVERLQGRIAPLEIHIDPKRSSSKLTVRGDTRPEDER